MPDFRIVPSIEQLRIRPRVAALQEQYGHAAVVEALRAGAAALRQALSSGMSLDGGAAAESPATVDEAAAMIESGLEARLRAMFRSSLRPVINATGVIVHTNLGRAPLSQAALDQVMTVGRRYSTLEYDLAEGGRGHRDEHAAQLLCRLTGAEAAVIVNNNAAATMLILAALAAHREVIVSRGELVEIGGGFRVPEVMEQSRAILREVGTTNRTRASDYEAAVTERTALILRVHRSNFTIEGFTEQPTLQELVDVGKRRGVPVVEDLGSGNLAGGMAESADVAGLRSAGLPWLEPFLRERADHPGEPGGRRRRGVRQRRQAPGRPAGGHHSGPEGTAGVDSAPPAHAGVPRGQDDVCGTGRHARGIRHRPRTRVRAGAAHDDAHAGIHRGQCQGRRRSARIVGIVQCAILDGRSTIGGGTTPGLTLPTRLLALTRRDFSASALEAALRRLDPPVIARIERDRLVLDLRTVFEDEDAALGAGPEHVGLRRSKKPEAPTDDRQKPEAHHLSR